MVYRIYVEKKPELANEAKTLKNDLRGLLMINGLEDVRVINRYDAENITKELFDYSVKNVFSEPQLDIATEEINTDGAIVFDNLSGRAPAHPLGKGLLPLRKALGGRDKGDKKIRHQPR